MTDAGARKIQVARNLLGPPNQAPSLPRPTPHRQLAAAAVRVGGTGTAAEFYGGGQRQARWRAWVPTSVGAEQLSCGRSDPRL